MFPKIYMSHPCWAKIQGGDRFEGTSCFNPRAVPLRLADLRPCPKMTCMELI